MNNHYLLKFIYATLIFGSIITASVTVDKHPRASRILRAIAYLLIPIVFITSGLLRLLDYQLILTIIAGVVAVGISIHSEGYYRVIHGLARYTQIVIDVALASLILLFSSTVFFELVIYWFFIDIIIAFIAITIEHGAENLPVASTYIAMCIAPSDIALLTAWAMLATRMGLYETLVLPINQLLGEKVILDPVLSIMLLFGFATKLGQFPLHSWPPVVYSRSPGHVSAILSSLVSKIGVYAYFVAHQLFVFNPIAYYVLLVQGVVSTIYGSFGAVLQSNIKRILAYSSISYGGVITMLYATMIILGFNQLYIPILSVVVFHALVKSLAFANTSLIYQLTNTYDVFKLGYLFYVSKQVSACALTILLNLTGTPPSMGFIVKIMLFTFGLIIARENLIGFFLVIAFIISAIFSIIYGAKFMSAYIATLPRTSLRTMPIPREEIMAETYLSIASITAPSFYILNLMYGDPVATFVTPLYIITLIAYFILFIKAYTRIPMPEDVKYWISGVES